ncbi:Zn finger protein [Handroanthus impetiginosus]|uniref:RING-type E3 ubiquitin transferase n=1 Tax=Handroanthus impetiginosus TaxID=429701 RepID=A0A2G9HBA7_9LAMI|nr:Zn finger protein [Handroanthus impetiginosus]
MARFSLGGDEDGSEGPSNYGPFPKRRRIAASIVYTSEEESQDRWDLFGDSSEGEEWEHEDEDDEQPNLQNEDEVQPTEAGVTSTQTGTDEPVSVTLADPDVLDCPVCLLPLGPPVYQCENGHIACSSCCIKMGNQCGTCSWPIGYNRCRAIEKVLESARISCQNRPHGCMESLNYSRKLDHEKTCNYTPCSCPHLDCNYVGSTKSLYAHFASQHSRSSKEFRYNCVIPLSLDSNQDHVFLQEKHEHILFILTRSIDILGSFVSIICIAQTSSEQEFFYDVTARDGFSTIKLKTVAESTPKWIAVTPGTRKYVLVPNDFITCDGLLKLEVTIWKDSQSYR